MSSTEYKLKRKYVEICCLYTCLLVYNYEWNREWVCFYIHIHSNSEHLTKRVFDLWPMCGWSLCPLDSKVQRPEPQWDLFRFWGITWTLQTVQTIALARGTSQIQLQCAYSIQKWIRRTSSISYKTIMYRWLSCVGCRACEGVFYPRAENVPSLY